MIMAPPMSAAAGAQPGPECAEVSPGSAARGRYEAERVERYRVWLRDRIALRKALDGMADLARWVEGKPTLTEMECSVLERLKKSKHAACGSDRTADPARHTPGWSDLLVLKMRDGTRSEPSARADGKSLLHLQRGEKLTIHQQHRTKEVLASMHMVQRGNMALSSHCLPSTLGGDNAAALDAYRQRCMKEHLDVLDECQAQGIVVDRAVLERVLLHPGDRDLSSWSRLRQPGTSPVPNWGGWPQGWLWRSPGNKRAGRVEEEMDAMKVTGQHNVQKVRKKRHPVTHGADSNAFWPGHEDHVRLYLPRVGISSEHVLFQPIRHNPVPCPACWPINEKGYYTSGNIDGNKTYTLF
ncbi:EF-hand calcium-binding domain-containing protein 12 isoform X2 [Scleropages formosus]|uniref:EF-hand calcium-binding domain-containing protein 12 isoform X2 n=1 Tax=Scleropages formosus TaxID=113540 RepID=UPI0008787ED1|nr:uncharacterized protein LOC108936954 isoform X2 [Scleropages formosus]